MSEPVHAGTDIPGRIIMLDTDLAAHPSELTRILIHEVFHFAWVRLGNPLRDSYAQLLKDELSRGARGELGWSAEYRKLDLLSVASAHPKWREYVCESFCDTAAWRYSKLTKHDEFTLAPRFRQRRERWFAELSKGSPIRA